MLVKLLAIAGVSLMSMVALLTGVGDGEPSRQLETTFANATPFDKELGKEAGNGGDVDFSGLWRLEWDDSIDQALVDKPKQCDLELKVVEGRLIGRFYGEVSGKKRDAIFTGSVMSGKAPLVSMEHREQGYSCVYQIFWSPSESGQPIGIWHDSNGARGEFSMLKYQ